MEITPVLVVERYHKDVSYFLSFFLLTLGPCFPWCVSRMCTRTSRQIAHYSVLKKQDPPSDTELVPQKCTIQRKQSMHMLKRNRSPNALPVCLSPVPTDNHIPQIQLGLHAQLTVAGMGPMAAQANHCFLFYCFLTSHQ